MSEETNEFLFLSRANILTRGIRKTDIIAIVEEAFREKGQGYFEMHPKPGIHTARDASMLCPRTFRSK